MSADREGRGNAAFCALEGTGEIEAPSGFRLLLIAISTKATLRTTHRAQTITTDMGVVGIPALLPGSVVDATVPGTATRRSEIGEREESGTVAAAVATLDSSRTSDAVESIESESVVRHAGHLLVPGSLFTKQRGHSPGTTSTSIVIPCISTYTMSSTTLTACFSRSSASRLIFFRVPDVVLVRFADLFRAVDVILFVFFSAAASVFFDFFSAVACVYFVFFFEDCHCEFVGILDVFVFFFFRMLSLTDVRIRFVH